MGPSSRSLTNRIQKVDPLRHLLYRSNDYCFARLFFSAVPTKQHPIPAMNGSTPVLEKDSEEYEIVLREIYSGLTLYQIHRRIHPHTSTTLSLYWHHMSLLPHNLRERSAYAILEVLWRPLLDMLGFNRYFSADYGTLRQ